jgi:hypothetical protein
MASLLNRLHQAAQERIKRESETKEPTTFSGAAGFSNRVTLKTPGESGEKTPAPALSTSRTESPTALPMDTVDAGTQPETKGSFLSRFQVGRTATAKTPEGGTGEQRNTTDSGRAGVRPSLPSVESKAALSSEELSATEINVDSPAEIRSVKDLASLNSDSIEEKLKPSSIAEKQIDAVMKETLLSGPEDIRATMDEVDSLMASDVGISTIALGVIRNKIESVMISLRDNPEWDSILLDNDVRNMVRFLRSIKGEAQLVLEEKSQKKAVAASKRAGVAKGKAGRVIGSGFDLKAMASQFLSKGK